MGIEMLHPAGCLQADATRCRMGGHETAPLNAAVWFEDHEHFVGRGEYRMGQFGATEATQREAVGWVAVVYSDVIVGAFLCVYVRVDIMMIKGKPGKQLPDAVPFRMQWRSIESDGQASC